MQFLKTACCLICIAICLQNIYCQSPLRAVPDFKNLDLSKPYSIHSDSGLIIIYYYRGVCKNYSIRKEFMANYTVVPMKSTTTIDKRSVSPKLITIHGNISYVFFYRSKIDTPFNQQNLQQHTERVVLDALIKEKYPFKVGFTARQSNSPFFRDLSNMNLNFDKYSFSKNMKQDLLTRLATVKAQNPDLKMIENTLSEKLKQYEALKSGINEMGLLQQLIEEREKIFYEQQKKELISPESLSVMIPALYNRKLNFEQMLTAKTDSTGNIKKIRLQQADSLLETLKTKKDQQDKLEKLISQLRHQSDSLKNNIVQDISKVRQQIYQASSPKELEKIAKESGISHPKKEGLENFLSGVKTLGIGRNTADYTELTAQNVMLTGINIEYNPSYYTAFAAGKIDYGFRDFFGRKLKQYNQHLVLGRIGWGDKDKRSFILTLFTGRKNNYAGLLAADSVNNTAHLFGYSIETIIKKNENTFISAEIAKSTKSNNGYAQMPITKSNSLFSFSDNTNMGLHIKAQTAIPETDTRLSGFFRKTGQAFQSFSLFTYNTGQQAWQLRADQSFFNRKINLTAMLRQNDFINPLAIQTFRTSTVFKSLQLNVRIPHLPIVNASYYPGSQFYSIDNNNIKQNAYYILNGSVLHSYRIKDIIMNSSFIYNHYFNKATDSGFILYKGLNYILSQSFLIKRLQLEGSYSYNKQAELNYYTIDANGDYSIKDLFRLGGGVKYNRVQQGKSYLGESIRLSADFKSLGGLQLQYEKSYLPTIQQTLSPVDIGKISWYKNF